MIGRYLKTKVKINFMSDIKEKEINELKIRIDRETCIGTGNCINIAPDVFELDNERIVKEAKDVLIEACSVCPVSALGVFDKNNEQIVP